MELFFLQEGTSGGPNFMFVALIFLIFMVFFTILPNRKMKKEQAKFMETMKKGDEVVTNGGIVGKITKMDEKTVTIEISPKNYMTVLLSSLSKQLSEEYAK